MVLASLHLGYPTIVQTHLVFACQSSVLQNKYIYPSNDMKTHLTGFRWAQLQYCGSTSPAVMRSIVENICACNGGNAQCRGEVQLHLH